MKIVTILGARPQFIKAAAVSREIANRSDIQEIIVHTGQHFDRNMSDIFFEEMQIPHPDYNLNINSLNHGAMTGRMILIENFMEKAMLLKTFWKLFIIVSFLSLIFVQQAYSAEFGKKKTYTGIFGLWAWGDWDEALKIVI